MHIADKLKERPIASLAIAAQLYMALTATGYWIAPESLMPENVSEFAGSATVNCLLVIILLLADIFDWK